MSELKTKENLVNDVIEQIKKDIQNQDITALEELLHSAPSENLAAYLPEELGNTYGLMIGREYEEKEYKDFMLRMDEYE